LLSRDGNPFFPASGSPLSTGGNLYARQLQESLIYRLLEEGIVSFLQQQSLISRVSHSRVNNPFFSETGVLTFLR
jgi:hypothetical protein